MKDSSRSHDGNVFVSTESKVRSGEEAGSELPQPGATAVQAWRGSSSSAVVPTPGVLSSWTAPPQASTLTPFKQSSRSQIKQ